MSIPNLNNLNRRLEYLGGDTEGRIIKGKYRTFKKVLYASYQGAEVISIPDGIKQNETKDLRQIKCLINPNINKQDYDEKMISADFCADLKNGSVVKWVGTETYWLVYLRHLTEDAYFRAQMRRARYTINFKNDDGEIVSVYASVQGPIETKINYIEKGNFRTDIPNWSLRILMPATDIVLKNIDRYSKIILKDIVWEVSVVDKISIPGVIEIIALETYTNLDVDDMDNKLAFGLVEEKTDPNPDNSEVYIDGKTFLKPKEKSDYSIVGINFSDGYWEYDSKILCEVSRTNTSIKFQVLSSKSGQTILKFVPYNGEQPIEKIIIIESLF